MVAHSISTIAKLLNSRAGHTPLPPLLYMTDETRVPNPLAAINQLAPGGGVIFRHYASANRQELAIKIKVLCDKNKLVFLIAGDPDLAQQLDADGLHLPEYLLNTPSLNVRLWRRRPNKLLTAAIHSSKSLQKCCALGVDAALASPVFPTKSHPRQKTLGVLGLTKIALKSPIPLYALGGITKINAPELLKSPVIGIAGISGIADNGTR